ncbi:MAG: hypothetical protein CM15mP77_4130 [Synechococcus sp.]|nr:MAG: hypothetical protein CM15mP77_4130 [Synechococcus sp.]
MSPDLSLVIYLSTTIHLNADGSSYSADDAVGLIGMRSGWRLASQGEEYVMQQFSWKGRSLKQKESNVI